MDITDITDRSDKIFICISARFSHKFNAGLAMLKSDNNTYLYRNLVGTSHTDQAMTLKEERSKDYVSKNKAAMKIKHSN